MVESSLPDVEFPRISQIIWDEKYRLKTPEGERLEHTTEETHRRVCNGIYHFDSKPDTHRERAFGTICAREFSPAGRIYAGAGTGRRVTLNNCYVGPTIEDSLRSEFGVGIMDALNVAASTMQQGGGIGYDFSPIRPKDAVVVQAGSIASGPLSYMDVWDAMCRTIMGGGARRGAMMATMSDFHPDLIDFITAKQDGKRFRMFNMSVLVSNELMDAVENDKLWLLGFYKPPSFVPKFKYDFQTLNDISDWTTSGTSNRRVLKIDKLYALGQEGQQDWYIWAVMPARDLWNLILKNTYEYSEPGVIFIDRINEWNNLYYCETIRSTNPCGEQPLPPNGQCCLGAANLSVIVDDPFSKDAHIQFDKIVNAVEVGVRFLDNVLDVTRYPTEEQELEAISKRRIGLGITGLANMLQMLCLRYGSEESVITTERVMEVIRNTAYRTSIELAKERQPFPLYDGEKYLNSNYIKTLPEDIRDDIANYGIRNALLLDIAPQGTTSIYLGNCSSGLEPTFGFEFYRDRLKPDDTMEELLTQDYGYVKYCEVFGTPKPSNGHTGMPDYMVTAQELTVTEHLNVQAACQQYIDASISKTINCPEKMDFEDFERVYTEAWAKGLKGCTTYRESEVRGSVLRTKQEDSKPAHFSGVVNGMVDKFPRPELLDAKSYMIKWPGAQEVKYYINLTYFYDEDIGRNRPFEIFIETKFVSNNDWVTALCRMLSAVFRRGGNVKFVVEQLEQVYSVTGGQWIKGRYIPSLVAMIGHTIARFMAEIGYLDDGEIIHPTPMPENASITGLEQGKIKGEHCPKCSQPAYVAQEGCHTCLVCGYSDCGG